MTKRITHTYSMIVNDQGHTVPSGNAHADVEHRMFTEGFRRRLYVTHADAAVILSRLENAGKWFRCPQRSDHEAYVSLFPKAGWLAFEWLKNPPLSFTRTRKVHAF